MSIIPLLATSLGVRNEIPNQELAGKIANSGDKAAVKELVENLNNKDKNIQADCIKALYEVAVLRPDLVAMYDKEIGSLLGSKNNRLVWGGMTGLNAIAEANPEGVDKLLPKIIQTADAGTVITKDHAMGILTKLAKFSKYEGETMPLIMEQLWKSPVNQFPSYCEMALPLIKDKYKDEFKNILTTRLEELPKDSQRKRIEKVAKKIK